MVDGHTKKALRTIILLQCAGAPAVRLFQNGFMLAYLSLLGFSSASVLRLLSLPSLLVFPILIPAAIISDRVGKKLVGIIGLCGTVAGFVLITLAGGGAGETGRQIAILGVVVFGIGWAAFVSNWFALISPLVPKDIRGRFFGRLRISWQSVTILLSLIISVLLKRHSSPAIFQGFLAFVTGLLVVRIVLYTRLPETREKEAPGGTVLQSLVQVLRVPSFAPFCSYVFLLSFCTGACPWIFGLLEKDVLLFDGDRLVFLGMLLLLGGIGGFFLGGKLVDRIGTKAVFLTCHFAYGLVIFLFVFRELIPLTPIWTAGLCTVLFGVVNAASGIAITTELLGLLPERNRSLATAFAAMLQLGGMALPGLVFSKMLDLNLLARSWKLLGCTLSEYDAILAGCGLSVVLLTVTLGLVPSIIRPKEPAPVERE